MLRDALYNLGPHSGASAEYAKGILVGVVSALMVGGMTFERAITTCSLNAPRTVIKGCVPESWVEPFDVVSETADVCYRSNGLV